MCRGAVRSEPGWKVCVALWLTAFVVGCASTRQVPAPGAFDSAADSTRLRNGIEIAGYVTSDGDYHSFHGTARLLDQSWHFVSLPVWGEPREEVTLPLDAVRSLEVEKGTYDNPIALAAGITIIAAAALGVWFTYAISGWHD